MDRRTFIAVVGGGLTIASLGARAQQSGRVARIGWLGNSPPNTPESSAPWDAFRLEMRNLGWPEGQKIVFVSRYAEGVTARYPQQVRELIDANVDLIVATTGPAAAAGRRATGTIPVVFASVPNPVEQGLVASLARPGGNLTGLTTLGLDLTSKRLELLKEAFPRARRIAFLAERSPGLDGPIDRTAERLGLQLLPARVTRAEDLAAEMRGLSHADAWFVAEAVLYFANRRAIIDLVREQRKPAMYPSTFFVNASGLMSYSVAQEGQYRRLAALVDRILRGAKPADIPVEQPTQFELAINMKTASELGLTIPPAFLLRADRVIQ